MAAGLKTTAPVLDVSTIDDIRVIESHVYDDLVTAHSLYDLFVATVHHHGSNKALTVLRSHDPDDVGLSLTHSELLFEITKTANMFRAHGIRPEGGTVAFLAPTSPQLPHLLLGAQIAGVASSLNYLLTREAIVDLLNAQGACMLVVAAPDLDETCWRKAQDMWQDVPTLREILVLGGDFPSATGYLGIDDALAGHSGEHLQFDLPPSRDVKCAHDCADIAAILARMAVVEHDVACP